MADPKPVIAKPAQNLDWVFQRLAHGYTEIPDQAQVGEVLKGASYKMITYIKYLEQRIAALEEQVADLASRS